MNCRRWLHSSAERESNLRPLGRNMSDILPLRHHARRMLSHIIGYSIPMLKDAASSGGETVKTVLAMSVCLSSVSQRSVDEIRVSAQRYTVHSSRIGYHSLRQQNSDQGTLKVCKTGVIWRPINL